MGEKKTITLEDICRNQLANERASSEDLYALVEEVVEAQNITAQKAAHAKQVMDDPMESTDARAARQMAEDVEHKSRRLSVLEGKLRDHLAKRLSEERRDAYVADSAKIAIVRDQASTRFHRVPELVGELASIYGEAHKINKLVDELHLRAPSGFDERLAKVEAHAGGNGHGDMQKTVLFLDGKQIWPPTTTFDPSIIPVPSYSEAYTSNWWRAGQKQKELDEARAAQELEAAKIAKAQFYGQRP